MGVIRKSDVANQVLISQANDDPTWKSTPNIRANLGSTVAANPLTGNIGVTGTLGIGNGGTNATTAAAAREKLGITPGNIGAEPAFTKNSAFNKNYEDDTSYIIADGNVSVGSRDRVARANHRHPLNVDTTNPAALGTASPGNSSTYARRNHIHPMPTAADIGLATTSVDLRSVTGSLNTNLFSYPSNAGVHMLKTGRIVVLSGILNVDRGLQIARNYLKESTHSNNNRAFTFPDGFKPSIGFFMKGLVSNPEDSVYCALEPNTGTFHIYGYTHRGVSVDNVPTTPFSISFSCTFFTN